MTKDASCWYSALMDVLACCTKRDNDGLLDENDETHRRMTMRNRRDSMKVQRQALITDHRCMVKTFSSSYEYNENDVLGSGSFGTVRKVHLKKCPTITRAVKELCKRSPDETRMVRREVLILRNLDHPNICKLFETFEDDTHLYLVMELITGRALLDELQDNMNLGHYDERWTMAVMRQVFDGLCYCHRQGVLHRDLKLENIMVDKADGEPHIKLIDFGMAVMSEHQSGFQSRELDGTRAYMAPEVAKHGRYSTASDMWSAGVVLFLLLLCEFPDKTHMPDQIQRIDSSEARELLLSILRKDPWQRISADEASKHPWTCGKSSHGHEDEQRRQTSDMQKAMTSFLDFYRCDKLQKAALTAVASQHCGQQLQDMRRHFQMLDSDGNGVITKEELVAVFEAHPVPSIKEPIRWVHKVFDELDSDGSGELEFTEFQAAVMRSYVGISEETMHAAFHALDTDGSGTISMEELGRVMRAGDQELMSYMEKADLNGDGVLDFDEFKAIFASLPESLDDTGGTYELPVTPCVANTNTPERGPKTVPYVRAPMTAGINSSHPRPCKNQLSPKQMTPSPPLYCFRPRRRSSSIEGTPERMPHRHMHRTASDIRF